MRDSFHDSGDNTDSDHMYGSGYEKKEENEKSELLYQANKIVVFSKLFLQKQVLLIMYQLMIILLTSQ